MTDTYEHEVNTINHQMSGELSEQVLQTVNGGTVFKRGSNPHTVDGETFFDATGEKKGGLGWSVSSKAEAAAVGTGTLTSFVVGLGAGVLLNKTGI